MSGAAARRGFDEQAIAASSEEFQFDLSLERFPEPVVQVLVPRPEAAAATQGKPAALFLRSSSCWAVNGGDGQGN